jgi:xanthine dehydrogenase small subunit
LSAAAQNVAGLLPKESFMNSVRFLHRGKIREIANPDPTLTVLRWLREQEGLTGTKEGCAEGDCGACTVALGSLDGDRIAYKAVNACILFLPVLDGKHLVTVEDLGSSRALHPVQQAMVDAHGSQCGFCTPGFVMSLFAQFHDSAPAHDKGELADALAGNLCRCTGYRPILDAGLEALSTAGNDEFGRNQSDTIALLTAIRRDAALAISHQGRKFAAPRTIDEFAVLFEADPAARILAGGTDLGLEVTKMRRTLDSVLYTGEVPELKKITTTQQAIEIGAGVTYTDAMPSLLNEFPEARELLTRLGAVQVRNLGTIGGNIANASPIGDTPPILIALGAQLVLRKGAIERRVDLDAFFTGYRKTVLKSGEFVARIDLPRRANDTIFRAYKLSKRFDQDISAVCGGFWLRVEKEIVADARLAFGGMAATPKRAGAAETALAGQRWDRAAVEAAAGALADDFTPLTDFRASAEYRLTAAQNLLRRFQIETGSHAEQRHETRVLHNA